MWRRVDILLTDVSEEEGILHRKPEILQTDNTVLLSMYAHQNDVQGCDIVQYAFGNSGMKD
jgi:hypothetical protein